LPLNEAVDEWLAGAKSGAIRTRSGNPYKPSVLRSYERSLKRRVLPDLGAKRITDVQTLVEQLIGEGWAAQTIHNSVIPLRSIFRREVELGRLAVNPCSALKLPAVHLSRDEIADPERATTLLEALPVEVRAVWATALYAGLRRGELQALDWSNVDLATGVIRVERSWDAQDGFVAPKSAKGTRKVPIAAVLRDYLVEHRMRVGRSEGLVFGKTATVPFQRRPCPEGKRLS
jgi:integrase